MDDPRAAAAASGGGAQVPTQAGPPIDLSRIDLSRSGPLDAASAQAVLARADQLLAGAEFQSAAVLYRRLIGAQDVSVTAAAMFGLGMSLYRLDRDDEAGAVWQQILSLPETPPWTYRAIRELAAMRVRDGDLPAAQKLYRDAEKRAPQSDRAEIASRLGWLAKELGDTRGANRYFARSRGGIAPPYVTMSLIAITTVVSIASFSTPWLLDLLALDKIGLAHGEYWRLFTVTLVHGSYLHLFFNMYALWLAGSLCERLYGPRTFLLIYVLSAAAGSVGSYIFGGDVPSVGASGAIFGLFGCLLAASRTHKPVLDRRNQMVLGQIGGLIVLNLIIGFGFNGIGGNIDNFAHLGGLIAGLWLGFLLEPGNVPTLGSFWTNTRSSAGSSGVSSVLPGGLRALGVVALVVAIALGVAVGTQQRSHLDSSGRPSADGSIASGAALAVPIRTASAATAVVADPSIASLGLAIARPTGWRGRS